LTPPFPQTTGSLHDRLISFAHWLERAKNEPVALQGSSFYLCDLLYEAADQLKDNKETRHDLT
jgi:hypothetical protein